MGKVRRRGILAVQQRGILYEIWKNRTGYFFLAPLLISFLFFALRPIVETFNLSFYKAGPRSREFVGLLNYIRLFRDPVFLLTLKNTLLFVVICTPLSLGISLFIALLISKLSGVARSFYQAAFYLPAVSAGIVMSMVWLWIFHPIWGILNYLLSFLGIPPIAWLGEVLPARIAVIIVVMNWTVGLKVILYLSALKAIPKTIYEAAEIDGVNAFQKFIHITFPLILPMTVYLLIMSIIGYSQIWESVYLLTSGGPFHTTTTIVLRIYFLGFQYFKFGQASVYAVMLFLIVFIAAFFQFKYLNKKLEF